MKKICMVATRIIPPWDDGLKNSLIDLAVELSKFDAEIFILTSAPKSQTIELNKVLYYKHVCIIICPYYFPQSFYGSLIPEALQVSLNLLYYLPKINKKYNFDIINSHSGAPLFALPSVILSKLLNIPTVHTLHSLTSSKIGLLSWSQVLLTKLNAVIITSHVQYKTINIPLTKVRIIADGIRMENFYPLVEEDKKLILKKLNISTPIIGFIGPLIERKGFHNFIEISKLIIEEYPTIKFLIMNSSSEKRIEKEIQDFKDHFIFTGYVENRNEIINCMDVVVFPFDYINLTLGQPIALLESMACGKPIIITDVEGIRDIITHDTNGLICPLYDLETMKNQILYLIRNDAKRNELAKSALIKVKDYDITNIAKQTNDLYEELLEKEESQ